MDVFCNIYRKISPWLGYNSLTTENLALSLGITAVERKQVVEIL